MSNQILEGVKILDLSAVLAGPMSSAFLGEFGAEVIRVEPPKGDGLRTAKYKGTSLPLKIVNRNKKCITLDLHRAEAVEQVYELAKWADVMIVNFRPETLKEFQIDYEDIIKVNPGIIYTHFSAYGRTGPYKDRPGFARTAEAFAGLAYITGYPDRPPVFSGNWIADGVGGLFTAYSIMLALYHKKCTGEGQLVDLALYESLFRLLIDFPVIYGSTGKIRERRGNLHATAVPNNLYETLDGKYLAMPVNFNMWSRLCEAMQRPDLITDERSATHAARKKNEAFVDGLVAQWVKTKTRGELIDILEQYKVAYGPVNSVADIFNDPHIWERGSLVKVFDDELGEDISVQGIVPKMSKTPGEIKWNGQPVGSANDEVFLNLLKMAPEKYQKLKDEGVI